MHVIHVGLSLFALAAASCSTPRDITYFQDAYQGDVVVARRPADIRVEPEDKLTIMVNTPDPALSSLFNLVQVQNRMSGTMANTLSAANVGASGNQVSFYTVDGHGDINFPVLGRLHIAGMTRFEVCSYIEGELKGRDLVKDPIVTVEFANTGITVLGEVNSPGRLEFNKDRLLLTDAIAMAGDLSANGRRDNILVLREGDDGTQKAYRVSLLDLDSLAATPVYYLRQNDLVYVEPNAKVKRQTTATGDTPFTPTFWMSVGSFGLTIATLIISLSK